MHYGTDAMVTDWMLVALQKISRMELDTLFKSSVYGTKYNLQLVRQKNCKDVNFLYGITGDDARKLAEQG